MKNLSPIIMGAVGIIIVLIAGLYILDLESSPEPTYQPKVVHKSTFSVNEESVQKVQESLDKEVVSKKENAMIQSFKKSDMVGVGKFHPVLLKHIDRIVVTHWAINKSIKENDIGDLKHWYDEYETTLIKSLNSIDEIMLGNNINDEYVNALLKDTAWNNKETMNTVRQKYKEALEFLDYFKENKDDF